MPSTGKSAALLVLVVAFTSACSATPSRTGSSSARAVPSTGPARASTATAASAPPQAAAAAQLLQGSGEEDARALFAIASALAQMPAGFLDWGSARAFGVKGQALLDASSRSRSPALAAVLAYDAFLFENASTPRAPHVERRRTRQPAPASDYAAHLGVTRASGRRPRKERALSGWRRRKLAYHGNSPRLACGVLTLGALEDE